jgi:uncharacterized protein (DUF427 family)
LWKKKQIKFTFSVFCNHFSPKRRKRIEKKRIVGLLTDFLYMVERRFNMAKKPEESVWDYPRPPRVEAYDGLIEVRHYGYALVRSSRTFRVLETSHPPVFYIPPADIMMELFSKTGRTSVCEFKGTAVYFDLVLPGERIENVAWAYTEPRRGFEVIKDYLAFYPTKLDACYVDGEVVKPQEGDFYGGWITANIKGPFKGGPGTWGW